MKIILAFSPRIFLIKLTETFININPLSLDSFDNQKILLDVLDTYLKSILKIKYEGEMTLPRLRHVFASIFNRVNSDDVNVQNNIYSLWDKLITWFFYHLFVGPENNQGLIIHCPLLLKIDNRIFFEIHYENSFPPDVLSKVTKAEYPKLFLYIKHESTSSTEIPCFTKYLMLDESQEEYLLITEIPIKLRSQLKNFNAQTLNYFGTLTFNENERKNANDVYSYLYNMYEYLDPGPIT